MNEICHIDPTIRVACIELDGSTLTVPAKELNQHIVWIDDNYDDPKGFDSPRYTIYFKTMLVRDYENLGEFDGW